VSYSDRAKASYSRVSRDLMLRASISESVLAEALRGRVTPAASPFDIIIDDISVAIELKVLVSSAREGQVFVNKHAMGRKQQYLVERGMQPFMIAIDYRAGEPAYYIREGVASYRLKNMQRCKSPRAMRMYLNRYVRATAMALEIATGAQNAAFNDA